MITISDADWKDAIKLLKESRECIAACFRTMEASNNSEEIVDRLEMEFKAAGVEDGIGVRLQNFIKAKSLEF